MVAQGDIEPEADLDARQLTVIAALVRDLSPAGRDELALRANRRGEQAATWWNQLTGKRSGAWEDAVKAMGRMIGHGPDDAESRLR